METLKNLRFTKTHEWLMSNDNTVTIGVTQHAQELLGDMVFVELPSVGVDVHVGDELGVLESVKAASDFYAPVSGTVIEVNQQVTENPALINHDPYGAGWLVKLKINDTKVNNQEIKLLLDNDAYQNEIAEEN